MAKEGTQNIRVRLDGDGTLRVSVTAVAHWGDDDLTSAANVDVTGENELSALRSVLDLILQGPELARAKAMAMRGAYRNEEDAEAEAERAARRAAGLPIPDEVTGRELGGSVTRIERIATVGPTGAAGGGSL